MTFRTCVGELIFITTESLTGAIDIGTTIAYIADASLESTDGIATGTAIRALGDVTASTNTRSLIPGVVGIDTPTTGVTRAEEDIYNGKVTPVKIDIKKDTTISLTILKQGGVWDRVYYDAPQGINYDGTSLYDGLTEAANNAYIGYRIYEFDGTSWNVFRHCRMLPGGYSRDPSDKNGVVRETIVFSCNDFEYACPVGEIDDVAAII